MLCWHSKHLPLIEPPAHYADALLYSLLGMKGDKTIDNKLDCPNHLEAD